MTRMPTNRRIINRLLAPIRVERRVENVFKPLKWTITKILRQRRADPSRRAISQSFCGAKL
jgi:hypothetical protein